VFCLKEKRHVIDRECFTKEREENQ
jgi:hypothetical protein